MLCVATLATSTAIAAAAYSLAYSVVGHASPITQPERSVIIARAGSSNPITTPSVSWSAYEFVQALDGIWDATAAISRTTATLSGSVPASMVAVEEVTSDYFSVLGVTSALGRTLQSSDATAETLPVVLSHSVWLSQFSGDRAVVGRAVRLRGINATIVGVLPAGFQGLTFGADVVPIVWIPARSLSSQGPPVRRQFTIAARLKPGVSRDLANEAVRSLQVVDESSQGERSISPTAKRLEAVPLTSFMKASIPRPVIVAILMLPGIALLVASTNLANLTYSRGVDRSREIFIRSALGASRWHVLRPQLLEVVLVSIAGAALGLLGAIWLSKWMVSQMASPLAVLAPFVVVSWHLDWSVCLAVLGAVGIFVTVAGVLPAILVTRDRFGARRPIGRARGARKAGARFDLIAVQVSASVGMLLVTLLAAEFVRRGVATSPSGVTSEESRRALVALIPMPDHTDPANVSALAARLRLTAQALPGVASVEIGSHLPMSLPWRPFPQTAVNLIAGAQQRPLWARVYGIHDSSLDTSGIRLVSGRSLRATESAEPVAVVGKSLEKQLFGESSALGREVSWQSAVPGLDHAVVSATVVGVWDDGPLIASRVVTEPLLFVPLSQTTAPALTLVVRQQTNAKLLNINTLRAAVASAAPDTAAVALGRLDSLLGAAVFVPRAAGWVSAVLGVFVLLLSLSGLLGVLMQMVQQRRQEMGVRMAVGAHKWNIAMLVCRDGLRPVTEGLVIALIGSLAVRQLAQRLTTDVLPRLHFVQAMLVSTLVLITALVTCAIPALRASRADIRHLFRD